VLTEVTGGYALGRATATGTIIDDDPGTGLEVSLGDASIDEGDAGARLVRLTATLSERSMTSVSVLVAVTSGTADCAATGRRWTPTVVGQDCDVTTRPRTVVFRVGRTVPQTGLPSRPTAAAKPIRVAVLPDRDVEGDETFTVTIVSASTVIETPDGPMGVDVPIRRGVATVTVLDDD
jgi:hypothetical protein